MKNSSFMSRIFGLTFILAMLALAGCSSPAQFAGECTVNSECPTGSACKISGDNSVGICICRSDEACGEGEICNTQGICQTRSACRSNVECPDDKFCDLSSGNCIDRINCGTDVHCLPGTVCDDVQGGCVDGCYDNGDCPLFSVCTRGSGAELLGTCLANRCSDNSFCEYGDFCQNGACVDASDPTFCQDCGQGEAACGSPNDFCLINSGYDPARPETGSPSFCGVECNPESGGTDCPNGYNCGGVVLLTQDQCLQDTECGGGGRQCVLGEGDLRGFCTCVDDADCAFNEAPPACLGSCGGFGVIACTDDSPCVTTCEFTCQSPQGRACTSDAQCEPLPLCQNNVCITDAVTACTTGTDCLCPAGTCLNTGRSCSTGAECNPPCIGGGCSLGAACAPSEGLLCTDVR